jgi:hypothetical protein
MGKDKGRQNRMFKIRKRKKEKNERNLENKRQDITIRAHWDALNYLICTVYLTSNLRMIRTGGGWGSTVKFWGKNVYSGTLPPYCALIVAVFEELRFKIQIIQ